LMTNKSPDAGHQAAIDTYQTGYPDVLRVQVKNQPHLNGNYAIEPDGRIGLGVHAPRIEGKTVGEIAVQLAGMIGVPPAHVAVTVAEYKSKHVLLVGEVKGSQRVHPYQGQETVLELLQRTGGITRGAAPESVYVVRPHVENGQRPEVFH